MASGKIKSYYEPKGYGFIIDDHGGPDQFFHITGCADDYKPQIGDAVLFTIGRNKRTGRDNAQDVRPVE